MELCLSTLATLAPSLGRLSVIAAVFEIRSYLKERIL